MMATYASTANKQKCLILDIRDHFVFFEAPNLQIIQDAVRKAFPDDGGIITRPLPGKRVGLFEVHTTSNIEHASITLQRIDMYGKFEDITIPLTTPGQSRGPRDGLLITIVDGDVGDAHLIPGSAFDEALGEFGEVLIPTKPQTFRDTKYPNGNLLIVLNRNDTPLPDRLEIKGCSLLLKYKGKLWNCSSCKVQHSGGCPYLKRFYELKERRGEEGVQHLVVADSTLRHAEQVGTRANIACISGATIGQVARAVEKAPSPSGLSARERVTIAAGANDVGVEDSLSVPVVAKKIEKSVLSLQRVAVQHPSTEFVILNTSEGKIEASPLARFADTFLKRTLEHTCATLDNVQLAPPVLYPDPWEDDHPSRKGTESILHSIAKFDKDFILDPDFLTSKGIYRGVTSGWRSGCSGCPTRDRVRGGFCQSCLGDIMDPDVLPDNIEIFNSVKEILDTSFMPLKRVASDVLSSSDDDAAVTSTKKPQYD